jgi:SprT-like family
VKQDAEATLLEALRARGVRRIRRVRLRDNRQVLLSVSKDGTTLNAHRCFDRAPVRMLDAVATFLKAGRSSQPYREAVDRIRSWPRGVAALRAARRRALRAVATPGRAGHTDQGTAEEHRRLQALYDRLNDSRFDGRLPDVLLRISRRMSHRYGQVQLHHNRRGERVVLELAINGTLLDGHDADLLDTVLHEMAHVEAWLWRGDRGHGPAWKEIAERVGCDARARAPRRPRRRPALA